MIAKSGDRNGLARDGVLHCMERHEAISLGPSSPGRITLICTYLTSPILLLSLGSGLYRPPHHHGGPPGGEAGMIRAQECGSALLIRDLAHVRCGSGPTRRSGAASSRPTGPVSADINISYSPVGVAVGVSCEFMIRSDMLISPRCGQTRRPVARYFKATCPGVSDAKRSVRPNLDGIAPTIVVVPLEAVIKIGQQRERHRTTVRILL
jgi:hypothetical protein